MKIEDTKAQHMTKLEILEEVMRAAKSAETLSSSVNLDRGAYVVCNLTHYTELRLAVWRKEDTDKYAVFEMDNGVLVIRHPGGYDQEEIDSMRDELEIALEE